MPAFGYGVPSNAILIEDFICEWFRQFVRAVNQFE